MKVLQVIHGYPMRYNAGSEVYTQGLCQALADRHEVHVFTRQENAFLPEYSMQRETDPADPLVALHVINMARARDGYSHREVDGAFAELLDQHQPDVVHVGHLNHLSTSLVFPAKERRIPVVFTLHDYWLMCPRGQFIQMYEDAGQQPWPVCDGQEDRKCAVRCYRRYFGKLTGMSWKPVAPRRPWSTSLNGWPSGVARCAGSSGDCSCSPPIVAKA